MHPAAAPDTPPATLEAALHVIDQQRAQLQRLQAAQEHWMRAVAHDLRAPLRHVISFAPLLRESVDALAQAAPQAQLDAQDAREFAGTMEQAARKMSAMLEGMTEVSRAARAVLHPLPVDWAEIAQTQVLGLQTAHPQVQWAVQLQPAMVLADAHWLGVATQVVLDNAVKFSQRVAQPRIALHLQSADDGCWQLQVSDNGAGFDDVRAQSLGQLFQRMHRESEFAGVGCGLALLDAITTRHAASWAIQGQLQQGCMVTLRWPAASAAGA